MKNKYMSFGFEIKEINDEGYMEGYASTFSNMDLGYDIVDPGAFKKTLRENKGKVPVLADHNPFMQIGWGTDAREDEKGLWVSFELDVKNNTKAKEKHSLAMKAKEIGAKSGLSIGFLPIKSEPDKENLNVRRLKEIKLFEYSMVAFPMNPKAQVTVVKNFGGGGLDESIKNFIVALKEMQYSDVEIWQALKSELTEPVTVDHSVMDSVRELQKVFRAK
jgi:hypothetical protein